MKLDMAVVKKPHRLKRIVSIKARKALAVIFCFAVIVLCETALPGMAKCESAFFIYRDLPTGIYSNSQYFVAYRYMRHIWKTSDGVIAAAVQKGGYEGHGLVLYKTLDEGVRWTLEVDVSNDYGVISDGFITPDNDILLVTSLPDESRAADVSFVRLTYDPGSKSWSKDPSTPAAVFVSGVGQRAARGTVAADSKGVLWCAFRMEDVETGTFQIRVFYSTDGGLAWEDSGNSFGTLNGLAEKTAKLIPAGPRMAMVYQDVRGDASAPRRFKEWAWRDDSQGLQEAWTRMPIAEMTDASGDPFSSHWSVTVDDFENIHLFYQDAGIKYFKYVAAAGQWAGPFALAYRGNYLSVSLAANNDLYLFATNLTGRKVVVRRYSFYSGVWSRWVSVSTQNYLGYLRMSSPERFTGHLPLLYQVNADSPYQLLYDLLDAPL